MSIVSFLTVARKWQLPFANSFLSLVSMVLLAVFGTANLVVAQEILEINTQYSAKNAKFGVLNSESEASYALTSGTYETLLNWIVDDRYEPAIASTWKLVDGRKIRFTLDDSHLFHDGVKLKAIDIVESFKAIKSTCRFTKMMLSNIRSVYKVNDQIVVISLHKPDVLALRKIAFWFRILPCSRYDCSRESGLPGTGRWKLVSKNEGNSSHPNEGYYLAELA